MGVTGVGKTSFINVATGGIQSSEYSLKPSTSIFHERERYLRCGFEVILVDCPGFDNAEKPDITILSEFTQFLREMAAEQIYLSGIIYLHRITDIRMSGSAMNSMQLLRALCGGPFLKHVTLVTTMWDSIKESVGIDREVQLQNNFWAWMLGGGDREGAKYARHYGTQKTANEIIDRFLDKEFAQSAIKSSFELDVVQSARPPQESAAGQFALEKLGENIQRVEQRLHEKKTARQEMINEGSLYEAEEMVKEIESEERDLDNFKRVLVDYRSPIKRSPDPENCTSIQFSPHFSQSQNNNLPGQPNLLPSDGYAPGFYPGQEAPPEIGYNSMNGEQWASRPSAYNPYSFPQN
jgi:GTPase SAR1 family protein